jgi:hypothetical protein
MVCFNLAQILPCGILLTLLFRDAAWASDTEWCLIYGIHVAEVTVQVVEVWNLVSKLYRLHFIRSDGRSEWNMIIKLQKGLT